MPSYLSDELLAHFKTKLTEQRNELVHRVDQYKQEISSIINRDGELSLNDNHFADQATSVYEQERDIAFYRAQLRSIERIDHALGRIESKQYGICDVCQQRIELERLEAVPETATCQEHSPQIETTLLQYERQPLSFQDVSADPEEQNFYDGDDALSSVLQYGNSSYGSEPLMMLDQQFAEEFADELDGYVEPLESFIATDITGNEVFIVRNKTYMNYLHSDEGDQELERF